MSEDVKVLVVTKGSFPSGNTAIAKGGWAVVHGHGPTGGYLIGFVPAAYLSGLLAESGWGKNIIGALGMMTISTIVIFVCGLFWLTIIFGNNEMKKQQKKLVKTMIYTQ